MVRILVAEDDDIMRITVVDHLRLHGWMTDEVLNGTAALLMMKETNYDIVLSDIRMPEMGGEQLLAEVKKTSPGTEVILMTAHGNTDDAVNCLK